MDNVEELVNTLTTKGTKAGAFDLKSLGLEDASNGKGSMKIAVGTPEGLPNIIVKVLEEDDACALFLWAVYRGVIESKHFPTVYAFVRVDGGYLAVMERCTGEFFTDEEEQTGDLGRLFHIITGLSHEWVYRDIESHTIKDAVEQIAELDSSLGHVFKGDFHNGNYCRRSTSDDTIVFFDPVYNRGVEGDVFRFWPDEDRP